EMLLNGRDDRPGVVGLTGGAFLTGDADKAVVEKVALRGSFERRDGELSSGSAVLSSSSSSSRISIVGVVALFVGDGGGSTFVEDAERIPRLGMASGSVGFLGPLFSLFTSFMDGLWKVTLFFILEGFGDFLIPPLDLPDFLDDSCPTSLELEVLFDVRRVPSPAVLRLL